MAELMEKKLLQQIYHHCKRLVGTTRSKNRVLLSLVLSLSHFAPTACLGQTKDQASVVSNTLEKSYGMTTIVFNTSVGNIKVTIPDDISASDTISGAVSAVPAAESADELAANVDKLNTYVLAVGNVHPHSKPVWHHHGLKASDDSSLLSTTLVSGHLQDFTFVVPKAGDHIQFLLRDKDGTTLSSQDISYTLVSPKVTGKHRTTEIPVAGECGKPINIKGDFSGDFSKTHVLIGGHRCALIAESPRQVTCLTPINVSGRTRIEVTNGQEDSTARFDNRLNRSAKEPELLDLHGSWTGTMGPISISQSGPFVTWDTGSIKVWGTVTKDSFDFEFHNYRYESRGKGHLEKTKQPDYKMYLEGYAYKTSVGNKPVSYPKHAFHIYRH
jgi:hypothetical protein